MLHYNCGGKLTVIESIQKPKGTSVLLCRVRKCNKCGAKITSTEQVETSYIKDDYKHRDYYKERKKNDDSEY